MIHAWTLARTHVRSLHRPIAVLLSIAVLLGALLVIGPVLILTKAFADADIKAAYYDFFFAMEGEFDENVDSAERAVNQLLLLDCMWEVPLSMVAQIWNAYIMDEFTTVLYVSISISVCIMAQQGFKFSCVMLAEGKTLDEINISEPMEYALWEYAARVTRTRGLIAKCGVCTCGMLRFITCCFSVFLSSPPLKWSPRVEATSSPSPTSTGTRRQFSDFEWLSDVRPRQL